MFVEWSFWNSEIAVKNVKKMVDKLGFDYVSYVLDWREFREIQLAFLKSSIVDLEMCAKTFLQPALTVHFESDGSVTRDGFVATFDCTTSGAPPPPHPCVSGVTITDGGAIVNADSSAVPSEGRSRGAETRG